jgi:putative addiction module killer protein
MLYNLDTTSAFDKWAEKLKDKIASRAIASRLVRVRTGNLGDVEPVGDGISEMRIFVGKGYRLYYLIRAENTILLLYGGNKDTQKKDIKKAKEIAKTV